MKKSIWTDKICTGPFLAGSTLVMSIGTFILGAVWCGRDPFTLFDYVYWGVVALLALFFTCYAYHKAKRG